MQQAHSVSASQERKSGGQWSDKLQTALFGRATKPSDIGVIFANSLPPSVGLDNVASHIQLSEQNLVAVVTWTQVSYTLKQLE